MDKIYLVINGHYERSVRGVFTDKEKANDFVRMFTNTYCDERMQVVEADINPHGGSYKKKYPWFIRVSGKTGEVIESSKQTDSAYGFGKNPELCMDCHCNFYSYVVASTESKAIAMVKKLFKNRKTLN